MSIDAELRMIAALRENPGLFAHKRILVVGDIAFDRTFRCHTSRKGFHASHGREQHFDIEPHPAGDDFGSVGGSNNNCLLAASLGAQTTLLTAIGRDDEGTSVQRLLAQQGLPHRCLILDGIQTVTRFRWYVRDESTGAYDLAFRMDKEPDYAASERKALECLRETEAAAWVCAQIASSDALLFNDTEKGFLSRETLALIGEWVRVENETREAQGRMPLWTMVDPKNDWEKFTAFPLNVLKANHLEACRAAGLPDIELTGDQGGLQPSLREQLRDLSHRLGSRIRGKFQHLIITLGAHGALWLDLMAPDAVPAICPGIPPRTAEFHSATHCGDVFGASLALANLLGGGMGDALQFANYTASLQYAKPAKEKVNAADVLCGENLARLARFCEKPARL